MFTHCMPSVPAASACTLYPNVLVKPPSVTPVMLDLLALPPPAPPAPPSIVQAPAVLPSLLRPPPPRQSAAYASPVLYPGSVQPLQKKPNQTSREQRTIFAGLSTGRFFNGKANAHSTGHNTLSTMSILPSCPDSLGYCTLCNVAFGAKANFKHHSQTQEHKQRVLASQQQTVDLQSKHRQFVIADCSTTDCVTATEGLSGTRMNKKLPSLLDVNVDCEMHRFAKSKKEERCMLLTSSSDYNVVGGPSGAHSSMLDHLPDKIGANDMDSLMVGVKDLGAKLPVSGSAKATKSLNSVANIDELLAKAKPILDSLRASQTGSHSAVSSTQGLPPLSVSCTHVTDSVTQSAPSFDQLDTLLDLMLTQTTEQIGNASNDPQLQVRLLLLQEIKEKRRNVRERDNERKQLELLLAKLQAERDAEAQLFVTSARVRGFNPNELEQWPDLVGYMQRERSPKPLLVDLTRDSSLPEPDYYDCGHEDRFVTDGTLHGDLEQEHSRQLPLSASEDIIHEIGQFRGSRGGIENEQHHRIVSTHRQWSRSHERFRDRHHRISRDRRRRSRSHSRHRSKEHTSTRHRDRYEQKRSSHDVRNRSRSSSNDRRKARAQDAFYDNAMFGDDESDRYAECNRRSCDRVAYSPPSLRTPDWRTPTYLELESPNLQHYSEMREVFKRKRSLCELSSESFDSTVPQVDQLVNAHICEDGFGITPISHVNDHFAQNDPEMEEEKWHREYLKHYDGKRKNRMPARNMTRTTHHVDPSDMAVRTFQSRTGLVTRFWDR